MQTEITWEGVLWLPSNLFAFPEVALDETRVDSSGTSRAFSLSLADVTRLSGPGRAFPNPEQRLSGNELAWWLRTPAGNVEGERAWRVTRRYDDASLGQLRGGHPAAGGGNIRPALIVHQ